MIEEKRILGADIGNGKDECYYNISWRNDGHYTKEHINFPIIKDNMPVGVIISIDENYVNGVIWNDKLPLNEFYKNRNNISVEIDRS